jgi:hypothetical protein
LFHRLKGSHIFSLVTKVFPKKKDVNKNWSFSPWRQSMCEVSRKGPKELSGVFRPWREKIFPLPLPSLLDVPSSKVPFVDSIAERNKARGKAHPHPSTQDPGTNRWMFCP